jgi:hypothetical protein
VRKFTDKTDRYDFDYESLRTEPAQLRDALQGED